MKYLFLILICSTAGAFELDISGTGEIQKGNSELDHYGILNRIKFYNIETKILSDYESSKGQTFWKHEGSIHYHYELNTKWSLFAWGMIGVDSKKQIDFQSKEVIGVIYKILPWAKYSVGIGHRNRNYDQEFVLSHRLKLKREWERYETHLTAWIFQSLEYIETDIEAGMRVKPFANFRFGILFKNEYVSQPLGNAKTYDMSLGLEVMFNWT